MSTTTKNLKPLKNTTKHSDKLNFRPHTPTCRINFHKLMPGGSYLRVIVQLDFDHAKLTLCSPQATFYLIRLVEFNKAFDKSLCLN